MDNDSEFNRDKVLLDAINDKKWDVVTSLLARMSPWDVQLLTRRSDIRERLRREGVFKSLRQLRADPDEPQGEDAWKSWLAIAAARHVNDGKELKVLVEYEQLNSPNSKRTFQVSFFKTGTLFRVFSTGELHRTREFLRHVLRWERYPEHDSEDDLEDDKKKNIPLEYGHETIDTSATQEYNFILDRQTDVKYVANLFYKMLFTHSPKKYVYKVFIHGPNETDKFLREPIGRRAGGSSGSRSRGGGQGSKFRAVMREYKRGHLHSGSKRGPLVTNPRQAAAIAYSEQRRAQSRKKK